MENFESKLNRAYKRFAPLAESYYYTFTRPSVTVGGKPVVLFLGNHSSGKSSLVNWLLGEPPVQDTGVAPTDDGFTFLIYGEQDEDVFGPAAVSKLPDEFRVLESFGSAFLQHLAVKTRKREVLKKVHLIDSPGMIDSAEGAATRNYDFAGAVKRFAELCDMVFFLFDPDKPGTTGETVNVFAKSLRGVEFKLRVLLNKCDAFTSLYDFARAYGTLCWNLSRVLRTKDLPKIFTVYSGAERDSGAPNLNLADFNRHRSEFLAIFDTPSSRRADSVFAAAYSDFAGLSMRMRIVDLAVSKMRKLNLRIWAWAAAAFVVSATTALLWVAHALSANVCVFSAASTTAWGAASVAGALVLLVASSVSRLAMRKCRIRLSEEVDDLFAAIYKRETAAGLFDDLVQRWNGIRSETVEIIAHAPLSLPFFSARKRAAVDKVASELLDAMAKDSSK